METICGIANVGPDADGFLYIGIADKPADANRIRELDEIEPIKFDLVEIVGIEREAKQRGISVDKYMRILQDGIELSELSEPLKTNILTSLDLLSYKGLQVVRIRIPRQTQPTFLGEECFLRVGSSTKKATGPQIAAASKLFSQK
jgi:predicted HTH transcriptional regulator